jgi:hypothetical protein
VHIAHLRVNGNKILIFIVKKKFVSVEWIILAQNLDPRELNGKPKHRWEKNNKMEVKKKSFVWRTGLRTGKIGGPL